MAEWFYIDKPGYGVIELRVSKADNRGQRNLREESPGSIERGCRLTAGEGDLKDSATENKCRILRRLWKCAVRAHREYGN